MDVQAKYRVLVVDDNPAIQADFLKILGPTSKTVSSDLEKTLLEDATFLLGEESHSFIHAGQEYIIDIASQGEEAFYKVKKSLSEQTPYAMAFIDVRMPPGWDGIETIEHIWQIDSDIETVICSAYSDYSWASIVKRLGYTDRLLILKKPFENIELRQMASALAEKWRLKKLAKTQLNTVKQLVELKTHALKHSYSLLKATLESTNDGILVTNHNKIINFNQRFLKMWKISKKILMEKRQELFTFLITQLEDPETFKNKLHHYALNIRDETYDVLKFKDNRVFECFTKPQFLEKKIIGKVWSFRDVTARIQLEEQLAYQATHDGLTGLPNRKLLFDRLQMALANAKRYNKKFAILFFDLDHFKYINDTLGHDAGDQILISVANRFKNTLRQVDTVCRLGGDEFVVIIEKLEKEEDVLEIVKKILVSLSHPFIISGKVLNITTCIGICFYPKDGDLPEVLFKNSDIALYTAKENGRNNFQFYNCTMNLKNEQRLELENQLRTAFIKKEFILHYQPIIDVKKQEITSVEALIRWQHPVHGLIMPANFISIAEECGLIVQLGEWVIQEACRQNKTWQDMGYKQMIMAVNLSPLSFKCGDIFTTVKNALNETHLEPQYLALEITESLLLDAKDETFEVLENLRKLGVTIIVDDFGVGYSNLNLIRTFPIDKLKIDRSFIRNVSESSNDKAVILAIIALAKSFQMRVLAEGVEEKSQLDFLQKHECDEVQGFIYSKALTSEEIQHLVGNYEMQKKA